MHELVLEWLSNLKAHDVEEKVKYFDGTMMTIRDVMWGAMLHHFIHHREQFVPLCRRAGKTPADCQ